MFLFETIVFNFSLSFNAEELHQNSHIIQANDIIWYQPPLAFMVF